MKKEKLSECKLYFITPNFNKRFFKIVEDVLKAGVKLIQFREKTLNDRLKYYIGRYLRRLCNEYDAIYIVNDRLDIALATYADGIHLGENDLPINVVREIVGKDLIIGRTVRSVEEAKLAERLGANYLGAGSIFKTGSKSDTKVIGIDGLKKIVSNVSIPVYAIGGINEDNIDIVLKTRVHGVAVISAIANSENPYLSTRRLLEKIKQYGR